MKNSKDRYSILFLDDEEKSVKYFKKLFSKDFKIIATTDPEEAQEIIDTKLEEIAVFVSDQRMPKASGVDLLAKIKERDSNIVTVLTTAYASLENNIDAINRGNISAYLPKPWDEEKVKFLLSKALQEFETRQKYMSLGGSIAHEIRNPLNNVRQSNKLIKEKLVNAHLNEHFCELEEGRITPINKKDFGEIVDSLDLVETSVKRGNSVIDIILNNISGKNIDESTLEELTISSIIKQTIKEYAFKNDEKSKVRINLEKDFSVKCQEDSLIYVFFNLIKNSLYYLKSDKNLYIDIKTEIGNDNFNHVYIKDNGPGIAKEKINTLFSAFSTSGKKEGTGLGLAFCKRTMEVIGGNISCNSKEGEFTEFTLTFPKLSKKQKNKKATHKILIVDDEETILLTKQSLLENNLHSTQCDLAYDAKMAINLARNKNYDLILTDIEMPNMNGIEMTSEIRKFNQEIPIIAYSSKDLKLISNNNASSKLNAYVEKSSDNLVLLKTVSTWAMTKLATKIISENSSEESIYNKKILVADDEDINLSMIAKYLSKYQITVDKAKDGYEALEMAKNNNYHTILLDITMPIMDGLEAAKKIKELPNIKSYKTSLIAITGDNSKPQLRKILNAGFDDYFTKGDDYDKITEMLGLWSKIKSSKTPS